MNYKIWTIASFLFVFWSCSDQNFVSGSNTKDTKSNSHKTDEVPEDIVIDNPDELHPPQTKTVIYDNETPPPKMVDYLLVIDNSSSMATALTNAKAGIQATIENKIFNDEARISMISTMPAKFIAAKIFNTVHPAVNSYVGIEQEPGFMSFAREEQLVAFAEKSPTLATTKFPLSLCENGSFSPYEKHPDGHYCVDAVLQTAFKGVGVEDGILSFYQTVKLAAKKALFRKGAEVNVVFISDVHAPGIKTTYRPADSADLFIAANRPDYEEMLKAVKESNDIDKLTFNSITPNEFVAGCTEPATEFGVDKSKLDLTYHKLVAESKGANQDICSKKGYEDFFKNMITIAQAQTQKEIIFDEIVESIKSVKINDEEFKDFTFNKENRSLVIDLTKLAKESLKIDIEYYLGGLE